MTLEDFFTLTEMKDGLTAPSRVHELVAVMQKEKDCMVKNIGDATRQWAAVASTIAATDNKDCLELFIQLDGLCFIDRWLKDAQKFGNDTADGFIEESITALLRALQKLQIDKEKSICSGIWVTVNNLLDHSSSRVKDRARSLFDSWKQGRISDSIHNDVPRMGTVCDSNVITSESNRAELNSVDVSSSGGNDEVKNIEPAQDGNSQSNSNCLQSENTEVVQINTDRNMEDRALDQVTTSVLSNSVQEGHLREKSTSPVEGNALTETNSSAIPKGQSAEPELDASKKLSSFSENSSMVASPSSKVEAGASSSSADAASAKEIPTEPEQQNSADAKERDLDPNVTAFGNVRKSLSPPKTGTDNMGFVNHSNTEVLRSSKDNQSHETQQDSSDSEQKSEKTEDTGTLFSRMAGVEAADDDQDHSSDGAEDLRYDSHFSKPVQSPDPVDRGTTDIDLEFGMVDALGIARQVAQEVEREVVDYREPSCSSASDKVMDDGIIQPGTPESINGNQEQHTEVPQDDILAGQSQSTVAYPVVEGRLVSSNNMDTEAENGTHELESSQVTKVAPEPESNTEKSLCDFDLNQEVCCDDMDRSTNHISAPVSVVSASRPAAASGSPSAPLQFEGILGWKGSAATSAFRPASPRKTSDGDKILETGVSSSGSKQRQDSLDIDLNVAEDGDEKVMDLISGRPIPISSGLQSGESSLEVGPRRSERPNLDLNRISDDGDAPPSGMRIDEQLFYPRNGHRSPSPASSSSSLRNFDLNNRPLFQNESLDQGLYLGSHQNASAFGVSKSVDPIISIMGTRVEVGSRIEANRKEFIPLNPSLPNGKPLDSAMDANVARIGGVLGIPTVPYTHSPVFGYNGLTTTPPMSFSSAVYGPGASIPYMDTRTPVVPQLLSTASAVPAYSQPSFIMSMSGPPMNLNGAGPSRPPSLDLNSGFAFEGGSGGGSLRQLFMPNQSSRSMEEHLRANMQMQPSSNSVIGGKRREPDSGWEPYSLPFKHQQPPWR